MDRQRERGERWLSTGEVARRLEFSSIWVEKLAERGVLPHEWTPLGRLFDPDGVERFAAQRAAEREAKQKREQAY